MSQPVEERLYHLLPAIYRIRDAEQGEPLRALLAVIERELENVEADIDGLYDNWFIETCDEWVVPYIADLLRVRPLHAASPDDSLRAFVANTLAYRRRKGTATVLEQLARDVTGWPARAVEFFRLLMTTQHMNHVRLENTRVDVRNDDQLELLTGPFDTIPHTADVRRIASGRGMYNIPNLGIFLWRLEPYFVQRVAAWPRNDASEEWPEGCFTFSPLGFDTNLFNRPHLEAEITHLAEEMNVPGPLRRRPLREELEARRQSLTIGETPREVYFSSQQGESVLEVWDGAHPLPPEELVICDLSRWDQTGWQPPESEEVTNPDGTLLYKTKVAVDPILGRLAVLPNAQLHDPHTSYAYGFSSDLGGGPYDRRAALEGVLDAPATWSIEVSNQDEPEPGQMEPPLPKALKCWGQQGPGTIGVITILDSETYEDDCEIQVPPGSQLLIAAAPGRRPHLRCNIKLLLPVNADDDSRLVLHGLLVEGRLVIKTPAHGVARLSHCTLVPGTLGSIEVNDNGAPHDSEEIDSRVHVDLERTICGPMIIKPNVAARLTIRDSIVASGRDGTPTEAAITAPDASAEIQSSTILGETVLRSLSASDDIFAGLVEVTRRQSGCLRFSYVSQASSTPRRYRCQPEYALQRRARELGVEGLTPDEKEDILRQIRPSFTSTRYSEPAYAQLRQTCATEIRIGSEDGSEMGVFSHLKQPQREANLRDQLNEYLPFGLEAGLFYVT